MSPSPESAPACPICKRPIQEATATTEEDYVWNSGQGRYEIGNVNERTAYCSCGADVSRIVFDRLG